MSRMPMGQFYPADSPMHRLDPRVKLVCLTVFVMLLLFTTNWLGLGVAAAGVLLLVGVARVPFRVLVRSLRMVFYILAFAMLINVFLTPGETVLFSVGFVQIATEGMLRAALIASRLVILVMASSLLTLTTSPIKLTDGIEALLRPTPLPAHDIAMMMTIALRMIPTLAEETEKIMKAQKARGASFSGSPLKRAKAFLPILVPLFVSSFKRADELATAMEARCYRGGANRTKLYPLHMRRVDWFALCAGLLFCGGLAFLQIIW